MPAFNHWAQRGTPLSNRRVHIFLQYVRSFATRAFSRVLHRERCQKVSCALRAVSGGDERENVREWNRSWGEDAFERRWLAKPAACLPCVALHWSGLQEERIGERRDIPTRRRDSVARRCLSAGRQLLRMWRCDLVESSDVDRWWAVGPDDHKKGGARICCTIAFLLCFPLSLFFNSTIPIWVIRTIKL